MDKRKTPLSSKAKDRLSEFREDGAGEYLTTNQGLRINDDQNSLKAGERGPSLLEDFELREKITHFDHERIPERVVTRAVPVLTVTLRCINLWVPPQRRVSGKDPASKTLASCVFQPFRLSSSSDLARDVRGFAVKFYTEER